MEILKEISRIQKKLGETDPEFTYVDKFKSTDKNGNEIFKEGTICPYNELLKQQYENIKAYKELCPEKKDINYIEIFKICLKCGVEIGMFCCGMNFEKNGCFTYETFRNFLRKPKL